MKHWFKRIVAGYCIGVGAVAPGISGGAIAVVFGVYQRITDAVAHLFCCFRQNIAFLLPLGIGGLLGVVSLGRVLEFCFATYPTVTKAVFWGLMAGTLPSVTRSACRDGVRGWYPMVSVATLTIGLAVFYGVRDGVEATSLSFMQTVLCGAILGFGTVVPGVSSSFILLSIGWYAPLLQVIGGHRLGGILPLMLGFGGTTLALIGVVDVLYKRWYGAMSFAVLGLLAASMAPIFPPLAWNRESCYILLLVVICAVISCGGMRCVEMRRFQVKINTKNIGISPSATGKTY